MARMITVKGIGKVSARPDYVVLSMTLQSNHMDYDKAMDMIQYFAQKEEAHIWKDPDGTKYMGFIEDDAYSIMSVSPDDSVFTNEMYYLDGLLFTDKIISSKSTKTGGTVITRMILAKFSLLVISFSSTERSLLLISINIIFF